MREVIAVCRSRKQSRDRVARVLDRYLWRIGDRTWQGKASNACLDRIARELRAQATRATAVTIREIRRSNESRMPLVRIGSRTAFSDHGLAPVASHPSKAVRRHGTAVERNGRIAVRIAILFHDLGKATQLFQDMLASALRGDAIEGTFIRHELFSAAVWDVLFGRLDDPALKAALIAVTPEEIDRACEEAIDRLLRNGSPSDRPLTFDFLRDETRMSFAVGMLILTHHRLPDGDSDHLTLRGSTHARPLPSGGRDALRLAPGRHIWHETWWKRHMIRDVKDMEPGVAVVGLDIALRGALVLADHLGSAEKEIASELPEILANTREDAGTLRPADSLSLHTRRVYCSSSATFDLMHRLRHRLPALSEEQMPLDLVRPEIADDRFRWQMDAANAARRLAGETEGGFFACLLAGTGTGKTRGAPTILAGAAFGDARPERRYFRMTLGLGLRVLATQSAKEYVTDLGLQVENVRTLVGSAPIEFGPMEDDNLEAVDGSESLGALPEWLRIERAEGPVPVLGSAEEENWLRGLSLDTDRGIPAILASAVRHSGKKAATFATLASTPIVVGTIDHLMSVAAPVRSGFLPAAIRTLSSDLILDEIDQYGSEDIAAIARLVYQAAAGGRRVIIMSATLTSEVAEAMHAAYLAGWSQYARTFGTADHVNVLLTGDAPGSVVTNATGEAFPALYDRCRNAVLSALNTAPTGRRGEILPPCKDWNALLRQVQESCSRMHDLNRVELDGFSVSVGLVRMTRISHTTALFQQLQAGRLDNGAEGVRLRVKLCLHSNMPRLQRAWIEDRLKCALTRKERKGRDPRAGLRDLCRTENLFGRAEVLGTKEIEIVCVTSPVIETGNDLDFDYAVVDPISLRSIIQTAGRVRRHRSADWARTNILILDRSPVVMESGKLAKPGVETPGATDETRVSPGDLSCVPRRTFAELAGGLVFDTVDASPILSDNEGLSPLKDAEAKLRCAMLARREEGAPLGKYLDRVAARMNTMFTRSRRFRRSTSGSVCYALFGEDLSTARWQVDLDPGSKRHLWRVPGTEHLHEPEEDRASAMGFLFTYALERAWATQSNQVDTAGQARLLRDLSSVEISTFNLEKTLIPVMTYTEQTGFSRNLPEDLYRPFGKADI